MHILSLLRRSRLDITNEKRLQNQISDLFKLYGVPILKEYRTEYGIIDFFLPESGVGLEIKIKGRPIDVLKQLERYAKVDEIKILVLITSKSFSMPQTVNEKPLYVLNISQSWL